MLGFRDSLQQDIFLVTETAAALSTSDALKTSKPSAWGGMVVRRECWTLSWWAKLSIWLLLLALFSFVFFFALHPFLAPNDPIAADYLVVEGWIPAYSLDRAKTIYEQGSYRKLLTCGAPVPGEWGTNSSATFADWGASKLRRLGMAPENIVAIHAGEVHVDRTYAAALSVRHWLQEHAGPVQAINVVTLGPHGRRSRLVFQKAFGDQVKIGIISVPDRNYRPDRWWQTSEGVREVMGETIAYLYARFFFSPSAVPAPKPESAL